MRDLSLDGWGLPARDCPLLRFTPCSKSWRSTRPNTVPILITSFPAMRHVGALQRTRSPLRTTAIAPQQTGMVATSLTGYEQDCHICRESAVA